MKFGQSMVNHLPLVQKPASSTKMLVMMEFTRPTRWAWNRLSIAARLKIPELLMKALHTRTHARYFFSKWTVAQWTGFAVTCTQASRTRCFHLYDREPNWTTTSCYAENRRLWLTNSKPSQTGFYWWFFFVNPGNKKTQMMISSSANCY